MNYLGFRNVGNNTNVIIPENTNNLVAVYDCPISGVLVTPTVNGTPVTNRFSFTSILGYPGMIAEMYPPPAAGTYLSLSDWNVTYFFFSGAGTIRSIGTAGTAAVTGLSVVNVKLPSSESEYIVGMAAGNPSPDKITMDGGIFQTNTSLGNRRVGAHQSNGTVSSFDVTMLSGGAGTLWFGFSSVTSLTTQDNSGGIIAIM